MKTSEIDPFTKTKDRILKNYRREMKYFFLDIFFITLSIFCLIFQPGATDELNWRTGNLIILATAVINFLIHFFKNEKKLPWQLKRRQLDLLDKSYEQC